MENLMGLRGSGVLAIWNGIAAEAEGDFYRWHNTEHMPERVGVPGFLRGRRYLATGRPRDFFTLYETETVETIRSAPYLARLNDPTPWTRRVLPHFRDMVRNGYRVVASSGHGQGGVLLIVRLHLGGVGERLLRRWAEADLALVRQLTGAIGVHVLEPVPETTRIQTKEKELRGHQPGEANPHEPWVLLVEGNDPDLTHPLLRGPLARMAAEPGTAVGTYRLQICLDRE